MNLDELANKARRMARSGSLRHGAINLGEEWYRIVNATGDRADVYIYGIIGSDWEDGDVTASAFMRELNGISASSIDLHINSPGGMVWDGVAIYSALLNHDATVNTFVDGVAASAASFVAMAGESRTIEKPAKMMIHNARGLVMGQADDMRQMADMLDDLSNTIADIYADRAGGDVSEWRTRMSAETWFTSEQAVATGLAHRVANDNRQMSDTDSASGPESRAGQLVRARARATLGRG